MKSFSKAIGIMLIACTVALCSAQKVTKVSLSANPVQGGVASTGTIEVSAKVAKTPLVVTLTSSNPAAVVPPTVTIAVGQSTVTFPVTTMPVAADAVSVLRATIGAVAMSVNLTVQAPRVVDLTFSPATVQGGSLSTGIVKISSAAPAGGIKLNLSSTTPLWGGPSNFVIPAGTTQATFPVTTMAVGGNTDATVTASLSGARATGILSILPPLMTSFRLIPSTVVSGTPTTASITLNGPAPKEGFRVKISCDSPFAKIPSTVTVPAGAVSMTFSITTKPVTAATTLRIVAGAPGAWIELSLAVEPAPANPPKGHGR